MANRVEKYLRFDSLGLSKSGLTKIWQLTDKHGGAVGFVKWYGGFRKYCFDPLDGTIWDSDGLRFITDFLEEVNKRHRLENKAKAYD